MSDATFKLDYEIPFKSDAMPQPLELLADKDELSMNELDEVNGGFVINLVGAFLIGAGARALWNLR